MTYSYINSNETSRIKKFSKSHSTMNGKTPYIKLLDKIGLNSLFSRRFNTLNPDFYIIQYVIFLFITITSINQFLRLIVMFQFIKN